MLDSLLSLVESLLAKPIENKLATLLIVAKVRLIDLGTEMPESLVDGDESQLKNWLQLSIETFLDRSEVKRKFRGELEELLEILNDAHSSAI